MILTKECEICKKNNDNKTYSFVTINTEDNNVTCGINGIINIQNIRIRNKEVICAKCGSSLYVETK